jgi:hypothetical protein
MKNDLNSEKNKKRALKLPFTSKGIVSISSHDDMILYWNIQNRTCLFDSLSQSFILF